MRGGRLREVVEKGGSTVVCSSLGENPCLPHVVRVISCYKQFVLCQIFDHMFIPKRQFIVAYWLNGPYLL